MLLVSMLIVVFLLLSDDMSPTPSLFQSPGGMAVFVNPVVGATEVIPTAVGPPAPFAVPPAIAPVPEERGRNR